MFAKTGGAQELSDEDSGIGFGSFATVEGAIYVDGIDNYGDRSVSHGSQVEHADESDHSPRRGK